MTYNHKRVRRASRIVANHFGPKTYPRPRRTVLSHSIRLALANWAQADRVTPDWWARALEAR